MFLPLLSILLHFGEIQRYTDIMLLSSDPRTLNTVQSSAISRYAQFAFIQVNASTRERTLYNLNFKSTPNLVCYQVNNTGEAGVEETIWFLEGIMNLCDTAGDEAEVLPSNTTTTSRRGREYHWHTSVCVTIIWPTSPINGTELSSNILGHLLKNLPKQFQIDSCLYIWFLDTNLFFELYYFRNTLIVRNVTVQFKNPISSVERRRNFELASITAGHVVSYSRWLIVVFCTEFCILNKCYLERMGYYFPEWQVHTDFEYHENLPLLGIYARLFEFHVSFV